MRGSREEPGRPGGGSSRGHEDGWEEGQDQREVARVLILQPHPNPGLYPESGKGGSRFQDFPVRYGGHGYLPEHT